MTESYEAAVPRSVDDARAEMRTYREQLGLAGGCVVAAGLAGSAIGLAAALPVAAVGCVGLGLHARAEADVDLLQAEEEVSHMLNPRQRRE